MRESPEYRYPVEQTLVVGLTGAVSLAPSELVTAMDEKLGLASCPLYLVARRPRLSIDAQAEGREIHITVRSVAGLEASMVSEGFDAELHIEDGGYFFEFVRDGKVVASGRAGQLLTDHCSPLRDQSAAARTPCPAVNEALLDLEVLYIGMSADEQGAAQRRLLAHSTLQQIMADHLDHAPQYELWVIPMEFGATNTLSVVHGRSTQEDFDESVFETAFAAQFDRETRIALAEAAAIRLFAPRYNVHYRTTFPNLRHRRYAGVFPAQYNALGISINTFRIVRCRLWSESRAPSFTHEAAWPLEPSARRSLATVDDILDLFRTRSITAE